MFITMIIMTSCDESVEYPPERPWPPVVNPDDFYKLHHHIRPTKPIRIPDTMAIKMRTAILETPSDTITTHPQDSLP